MITFEKSAGAVVFREENGARKYLLLFSNYWEFPKGHQEEGESEEQAARRETKEEAGIGELKFIPGFREEAMLLYHAKGEEKADRIRDGRKTIILKKWVFYLAQTDETEIKISREHNDYKWFSYEEALAKLDFKKSRRVLIRAHKFLETIAKNKISG